MFHECFEHLHLTVAPMLSTTQAKWLMYTQNLHQQARAVSCWVLTHSSPWSEPYLAAWEVLERPGCVPHVTYWEQFPMFCAHWPDDQWPMTRSNTSKHFQSYFFMYINSHTWFWVLYRCEYYPCIYMCIPLDIYYVLIYYASIMCCCSLFGFQ